MPIWWLTSDIVYFDSELALTVKQFFMQKNNTILDKIVSHCYGLIMQKISQPVILKTIFIFGERFYLQIVLLKPTKLIILKTLLICHRMQPKRLKLLLMN